MDIFFVREDGSAEKAAWNLLEVAHELRSLFPKEPFETALTVEVPRGLAVALQDALIQWEKSKSDNPEHARSEDVTRKVDDVALALAQALGRIHRIGQPRKGGAQTPAFDRSGVALEGSTAVVFQPLDVPPLEDAVRAIYRSRKEKLESDFSAIATKMEQSLIAKGNGQRPFRR